MNTIIFAGTGEGKTGLLAHIGWLAAFNRERNRAMRAEIISRNENGFNLTVPKHCVAANIEISFLKNLCYPRRPRIIDPDRLGLQSEAPEGVRCHYTLPFETILIDEAQKYYYSKGDKLPKYKVDFFEKNRHNDLDIYMTTPSAMEIAKDIRRISRFWHVLKRELVYKGGKCQTKWIYNEVATCDDQKFEEYMNDFKAWKCKHKNKIVIDSGFCFETKTIIAPYNVFTRYNHQSHRSEFITGHVDEDFDLFYGDDFEPTTYEDFKKLEGNG